MYKMTQEKCGVHAVSCTVSV